MGKSMLKGGIRGGIGGAGIGGAVGALKTPQQGQNRLSNMRRGAIGGAAIGGAAGTVFAAGSAKFMNSPMGASSRQKMWDMRSRGRSMFKGGMMPQVAQPIGRPPKLIPPRTPTTATGMASQQLSPISTKVAELAKEAGHFDQAGKATARGVQKARHHIKSLFKKPPPPPQFSNLSAVGAGAGAGAMGLGTLGALKAKKGDRVDSFVRNAVMGAGLGAGAGLLAKGPANEYLAARYKTKLFEKAMKKTAMDELLKSLSLEEVLKKTSLEHDLQSTSLGTKLPRMKGSPHRSRINMRSPKALIAGGVAGLVAYSMLKKKKAGVGNENYSGSVDDGGYA